MRIAVPMSNGQFSQHFGQSSGFWVCDAQQDPPAVSGGKELAVPREGGCGAIPGLLAGAGVDLVIAGGIGGGAVQNLQRVGIKAVAGAAGGSPEALVMAFLRQQLVCTGDTCHHHDDHGGHAHGTCHGHDGESKDKHP